METTNQSLYIPGKITAVLSYCTVVGSLLALLSNLKSKHKFARFHIRQALGINLLMVIGAVPAFDTGSKWLEGGFWVVMLILWAFGFFGAVQDKEMSIPVLGPLFQRLFSFL